MSDFSKLFKRLFNIPEHHITVPEVASALHGIAADSDLGKKLIETAEIVITHPPITGAAIVTDLGLVIAVFDPAIVSQVDQVANSGVAKLGAMLGAKFNIPEAEVAAAVAAVEAEGDRDLNAALEAIGLPAPVVQTVAN